VSDRHIRNTVDKDDAKRGAVVVSIFRCIQGEKDTCVDNRCVLRQEFLQVVLTQCNTGRRETTDSQEDETSYMEKLR